MPGKRTLTMRQLRHLLCLIHGGTSTREVCRILGLARSTVQDDVRRAAEAGLSWPLPGDLTDDALERLLFVRPGNNTGARLRAEQDWIGSHVRLFRFLGGVPRLIVPDNLKAGVNRASFYDPEINRSYAMMASHYGTAVLPARPRRPRSRCP